MVGWSMTDKQTTVARWAETIVRQLSQKAGIIAVGFLLLIMLLTVADVTLRYLFNRPITFTLELTTYMMVLLAFLALSWCALTDKHVRVDLILSKFSKRKQEIFDITNHLLVLVVCVLIGWRVLNASFIVRDMRTASTITDIPYYPFYWVITLSYALLFLVMVVKFVQSVYKVIRK